MASAAAPLFDLLVRMGDSCLILAHRNSEWCGHAPVLEEDIAMANMALDLLGQCRLWLEYAGEAEGQGRTADNLAYLRDAGQFRNFLLCEQPNDDFGRTLMRQFLFDAWHVPMLEELQKSSDQRIAEIAEKASREATYHLERSTDLVERLGDGTQESNTVMQVALDDLWAFTAEFFAANATDAELAGQGIVPDPASLKPRWSNTVDAVLGEASLTIPQDGVTRIGGKDGRHSEHLGFVLAEMQFLQRAYPGATW